MKRLEAKHPLAIRWFHWINFPVLFTMIWSGLLIYWANDVYRVGLGKWTLFHFKLPDKGEVFRVHIGNLTLFQHTMQSNGYERLHLDARLAEGMGWHFFFMWIFFGNGLLYVLFTAISGEWRYLLPNKNSAKEAIQVVLHDLKLRKEPLPPRKFNGAQQIAYTGVILMGLGSLLTGLAIYKPTQFAWVSAPLGLLPVGATPYEIARFIHFWLTWGYVGFFLVHVMQVVRAGWNNFRAMITGYEIVRDEGDLHGSPANH